jgi:hypothetical protein
MGCYRSMGFCRPPRQTWHRCQPGLDGLACITSPQTHCPCPSHRPQVINNGTGMRRHPLFFLKGLRREVRGGGLHECQRTLAARHADAHTHTPAHTHTRTHAHASYLSQLLRRSTRVVPWRPQKDTLPSAAVPKDAVGMEMVVVAKEAEALAPKPEGGAAAKLRAGPVAEGSVGGVAELDPAVDTGGAPAVVRGRRACGGRQGAWFGSHRSELHCVHHAEVWAAATLACRP